MEAAMVVTVTSQRLSYSLALWYLSDSNSNLENRKNPDLNWVFIYVFAFLFRLFASCFNADAVNLKSINSSWKKTNLCAAAVNQSVEEHAPDLNTPAGTDGFPIVAAAAATHASLPVKVKLEHWTKGILAPTRPICITIRQWELGGFPPEIFPRTKSRDAKSIVKGTGKK